MGKVYLLNAWGTNNYKIGITKGDVNKRISQLQTGCPNEIVLLNQYESDNYRRIESWLHRQYKRKNMEGEWFQLSDEEVINFINECERIDKTITLLLEQNPFFK